LKAISLNLLAWAILPIMDGFAKYLSTEMPVIQIIWARYFFMVLITVPLFLFFSKNKYILPKNLPIQLLRSIFLFLSTICFFYAISVLSLAEALTLAFIYPMISTLLSSIVLKEKVGIKRWIAVIIGFIGALIVLRPGFDIIHLASFAGLGTGVAYAFYVISTKKLSNDNAFLTLTFSGLVGAVIISFFVPFVWVDPNYQQWIFMIALASFGTLGHFFLILSLKFADASKLAPLGYFEIVTNIIIGYYFFGDFPDFWIWLGLFIIVSSGIYISIRENIKNKKLV
tara:strand:- start:209 stop:1060 length:852 start_codon:yes stop_codon:yes gene_type:complete